MISNIATAFTKLTDSFNLLCIPCVIIFKFSEAVPIFVWIYDNINNIV